MKAKMMMCCLTFATCGALAQHDHHAASGTKQESKATVQFKDANLGKAYEQYIKLKDALVASDEKAATSVANDLLVTLNDTRAVAASKATSELIKALDIDQQRLAFSTLSTEMAKLVKGGKLTAGSLYLEYCPMANNNSGAFWLSNEKEIRNPYFGDMMLKCGSVKETIQ